MIFTHSVALFVIPIAVGIITEGIKFLNYIRKHGWNINYSIAYGHMPSAHTAYVLSLVTTMWIFEGYHSSAFAIAFIMAIIVIMDALRLRVYMGQYAKHINDIVTHLNLDPDKFPALKERVGHKPAEVVVGALCGIVLTLLITAFIL
ncbi:MAG: divergent PAP2 family protein [Candidatus Moranbacteria bacterium]|nr:divergent PAP2 family protein [Candidatus Moranbacteria bacterium]